MDNNSAPNKDGDRDEVITDFDQTNDKVAGVRDDRDTIDAGADDPADTPLLSRAMEDIEETFGRDPEESGATP